MAWAKLKLFGGFSLSRNDGEEISIAFAKERALIAYLALHPGKRLSRGHLAGLLWGEQPEQSARHSLSQALSSLCGKLDMDGDSISRGRQDVVLNKTAIEVDVERFKVWAVSNDAEDIHRAVDAYRVDLFSEFELSEPAFDDWARGLRSECFDLMMQGGIAYLVGEHDGLKASDRIAVAQRLLRLDPCSELVHQALIRIYTGSRQNGAALQQFATCRAVLQEELGISPGPETERLVSGLPRTEPSGGGAKSMDAQSDNPRDIPSLVVMPFADLEGEPQLTTIASGLTDDITTELTRLGSFFVISRESAFAEQISQGESPVICRRLGVRHALRGSIRRAGRGFRINLRLVDGETGRNVWAESYRLDEEELLDLPQEVIGKVVGRLASWLDRDFLSRARMRPTKTWGAYSHLLQGLEFHHRNWYGIHNTLRAIKHFEHALELDPNCARAYAYLACANAWPWFKGRQREKLDPSMSLAQRAVELDPMEVEAHRVLGGIHLIRGEHDLSRLHFEDAQRSHPGHAHVLAHFARYFIHDGTPQEAISLLSRARQLNPLHPPWYWEHLGIAFFAKRDYQAALDAFSRMLGHSFYDRLYAAAAAAHSGQVRHAASYLSEALDKKAGLRLSALPYFLPYRRREDLVHVLEGLKKAGLPD